jgi:hypothetical protein
VNKNKRVYVPEVPEEEIRRIAARITPLKAKLECDSFTGENRTQLYEFAEQVDPVNASYIWKETHEEPSKRRWRKFRKITTYHGWSYYGFFKPSVGEVVSQFFMYEDPTEFDPVVAFAIVRQPETASDFDVDPSCFDASYHIATTQLYLEYNP